MNTLPSITVNDEAVDPNDYMAIVDANIDEEIRPRAYFIVLRMLGIKRQNCGRCHVDSFDPSHFAKHFGGGEYLLDLRIEGKRGCVAQISCPIPEPLISEHLPEPVGLGATNARAAHQVAVAPAQGATDASLDFILKMMLASMESNTKITTAMITTMASGNGGGGISDGVIKALIESSNRTTPVSEISALMDIQDRITKTDPVSIADDPVAGIGAMLIEKLLSAPPAPAQPQRPLMAPPLAQSAQPTEQDVQLGGPAQAQAPAPIAPQQNIMETIGSLLILGAQQADPDVDVYCDMIVEITGEMLPIVLGNFDQGGLAQALLAQSPPSETAPGFFAAIETRLREIVAEDRAEEMQPEPAPQQTDVISTPPSASEVISAAGTTGSLVGAA